MYRTSLKILLVWTMIAPASAQVHKWVDENGVTHYGDGGPRNAKTLAMPKGLMNAEPAPGATAQPTWQEQEKAFQRRQIAAAQAEAKANQQQAAVNRACNGWRSELAAIKSAGRLAHPDGNGGVIVESDAGRQATIDNLERQIAERCQ